MNKHFNIFKSFSQDDKIQSKIISRYAKKQNDNHMH